MATLLARPHRDKQKQGRSQSLQAGVHPISPNNFEAETEKIPRDENPDLGSSPRLQIGEMLCVQQTKGEETYPQPQLFDEWSYLKPDERGAELGREARVWQVYVGETDKWDKEVIEGWDKSMDVLLGRVILSHINYPAAPSFVIESSGMLKEDPNDVSAATLLVISQALVTIASGNSSSNPTLSAPDQSGAPAFAPSRIAIIINTLWYLSLGLSIATSFLAMLAKDWCYSFSAHRTGHPCDQAHRRQRKWKLIERWKMQELIVLLPSLMHLSLLLFVVGLCIYLWDLNHTAAIPVICVAGASLVFYIWSSIAASLVEFFPYTTIISRIFRSSYMQTLYPTTSAFFSLLDTFLDMVYSWITNLYTLVIVFLALIPAAFSGLFLILDRYSLQRFAKTGDEVVKLCYQSMHVIFYPGIMLWHSIYLLYAAIRSFVKRRINSLELTEDLTTSLALSWLIQNCETPGAVDIALQAIAGASQRIPKGPLLASQATEQIMRRIVSRGSASSDHERSINTRYTRSLEFLGLDSELGSVDGTSTRRITEDLEVMLWDLKSKNERTIADLIKDGSFVPTEDNLEAMKIGNSATSQSLRFLAGEARESLNSFGSITRLLSRHLEPNSKQLHPAAVRSLANATILHTSLSTIPGPPSDLVRLCMAYCEGLIRELSQKGVNGLTHNFDSGILFIICVLLCGRPCGNSDTPADTMQHIPRLQARALHTIRTLMDLDIEGGRFQVNVFWTGCSEILSNLSVYGLDEGTDDWGSLKRWCSKFTADFVGEWGTPYIPSWSRDNKPVHWTRNKLLMAMNHVYGLVVASSSYSSTPIYLPDSIYTTLVLLGCGNALDSWQARVCDALLSRFGFPRMSEGFITGLEMPTDGDDETVLSAIGTTYSRKAQPRARRQFAAIQLWLLFHLIEDSSSDHQQRLKDVIERQLKDTLKLQFKGFDQVKEELEPFIIEGYRKAHTVNGDNAGDMDGQSSSVWDTVKTGLLSWPAGNSSQSSSFDLRTRPYLFKCNHPTDFEDRHSQGKYQRAYTARVVEVILRTRGFRGNEDLEARIEDDFRELLPCFQKILPIFAPLPSSATTSQVSLVVADQSLILPGAEFIPGTGHVLVEVHDPTLISKSGDQYSD